MNLSAEEKKKKLFNGWFCWLFSLVFLFRCLPRAFACEWSSFFKMRIMCIYFLASFSVFFVVLFACVVICFNGEVTKFLVFRRFLVNALMY